MDVRRLANFPRLSDNILVHYVNFSDRQGNEPGFVGTGKHPTLRTSRDGIQISRITCPVGLHRDKALRQSVVSSSFQLAVRPAGERRDELS
jgi:hypothetical protein